MEVSEFLELLIKELSANDRLNEYYKLASGGRRFLFRKAYLQQRLEYIKRHIPSESCNIWDAGCGYGTTSIFLALNGHRVKGTTLEYYFSEIERRKQFWSRYGNLDKLTVRYENIFETDGEKSIFNIVVLQDTLHHLEPVDDGLRVFRDSLKPGGRVIAIEENGSSFFIIIKNILKRGLAKRIEYFDEALGKKIIMADENARSLKEWYKVFMHSGFSEGLCEAEYIRLMPPFFFTDTNYSRVIACEQNTWKTGYFPSKYFFFGINFIAEI